MQFATQRMALLQDSHHPMQAGFGSSRQDTCRSSSLRSAKSYFENIEYVKVPAFWAGILNPYQLQHALASVSERWVNKNWSSADARDFPPEPNQTFDTALLNPPELIPEGSGSAIAVMSYVTRVLQLMICESDMFKDNLM